MNNYSIIKDGRTIGTVRAMCSLEAVIRWTSEHGPCDVDACRE